MLDEKTGELDRVLKVAAFQILTTEELRQSIEDKALMFFGVGKYRDDPFTRTSKLPERLKGLESKKPSVRLKTAVSWFCELTAFDDQDRAFVRDLVNKRNDLAHNFLENLLNIRPDFFSESEPFMAIILTNKINKWWINNYERGIDPEAWDKFSEEEIDQAEIISAQFTRSLFLIAFPKFSDYLSSLAEQEE